MLDTTTDSCRSQRQLFTTRYSYGSRDQEFVFCCRGRPFAALVSPNLPTPTSSLIDYDLVKSLGLKMTDLQCKKFYFAGNKMRILGRISTTVQCIQNGRTGSNFHIKGFVIVDLYKILDTHCVAGNKMQEQIRILLDAGEASEDDDDDEDINEVIINERKCETVQETFGGKGPSSHQTGSLAPRSTSSSMATSRSSTCGAPMSSSSTFTPTAPTTSIPYNPGAMRTPIPPGIVAKPHSSLYAIVGRDDSYHDAMGYWEKFAEEKPFKTTWEDGKPRVVNVSHVGGNDDMLRIGDWDQLEDPKGHQARHVLLANIRRESPDRVCPLCSYNLSTNHVCSPSIKNQNDVANHCDDCHQKLRFIRKEGRYIWEIPPLEI